MLGVAAGQPDALSPADGSGGEGFSAGDRCFHEGFEAGVVAAPVEGRRSLAEHFVIVPPDVRWIVETLVSWDRGAFTQGGEAEAGEWRETRPGACP